MMKTVELTRRGSTALMTLNRPETLNALQTSFLAEISNALDEVEKDSSIYVLIITGKGKAFIAGADIKEWNSLTSAEGLKYSEYLHMFTNRLEQFRLPVIAAINGFALGGGCEFAMACDFRIASDNAKFGQPEVGLGVIAGAGGTQRLPRLIGVSKAKELLYTGRTISANEALTIGLADRVVAPDQLLDAAYELADAISANGQIAVQETKRAINRGIQADIATGLAIEAQAFAITLGTEDKKIGAGAFINKIKDKKFVYR